MKTFASLILGGVAALSICMIVGTLMMLPRQGAKDRTYAEQFQQAAKVADAYFLRNGQLPDDATFGRLVGRGEGDSLSLSASAGEACEHFTKGKNDRFVLSRWRGEWAECFSYPSGRTTLMPSWRDQVLGFGPELAFFALVAAGALFGSVRIWRHGARSMANAA